MKKNIYLLPVLAGIMLLTVSCGKSSCCTVTKPTTPTVTPSVTALLTSIIDNNPGDKDYTAIDPKNSYQADSVSTGYGQPIFQFTYNGTQLTKVLRYLSSKAIEIFLFTYDTQGHCTGSTISVELNGQILTGAQLGDTTATSSIITYTGNFITEQKFYTPKNVLYDDVTYTWQNNDILNLIDDPSSLADYTPYANTYVYDGNNNNVNLETTDGLTPLASTQQPISTASTMRLNRLPFSKGLIRSGRLSHAPLSKWRIRSSDNNFFQTFDTHNNFSLAFPFWWVILGPDATEASFAYGPLDDNPDNPNADIIFVVPGAHNPLSDMFGDTYTYQYNTYDYPSVETLTNGGSSESVKYNYLQVN